MTPKIIALIFAFFTVPALAKWGVCPKNLQDEIFTQDRIFCFKNNEQIVLLENRSIAVQVKQALEGGVSLVTGTLQDLKAETGLGEKLYPLQTSKGKKSYVVLELEQDERLVLFRSVTPNNFNLILLLSTPSETKILDRLVHDFASPLQVNEKSKTATVFLNNKKTPVRITREGFQF